MLVVAVADDELPKLEAIHANWTANGVEGLRLLDAREAGKLEPNISCVAALLVPSTGLVDSHALMRAFILEAKEGGADIAYGVTLEGVEKTAGGYRLRLREASGETSGVECRRVVNAAGNACDDGAARPGAEPDPTGGRSRAVSGWARIGHG